jgi:hypothetical protein
MKKYDENCNYMQPFFNEYSFIYTEECGKANISTHLWAESRAIIGGEGI